MYKNKLLYKCFYFVTTNKIQLFLRRRFPLYVLVDWASPLIRPFFRLFGRNFSTLRMEKETNRNLTENWVAYANLPSKLPNFTQIEFWRSLGWVACLAPSLKIQLR